VLGLGGYDVFFLGLVETSDSLDGYVVGFCGSGRENDFLWVCANQGCDRLERERERKNKLNV
jgi:hypothetical protein